MTFTSFTSFSDPATANIRIWGQAISSYLDTIHPKTNDTGQVDWSNHVSTSIGYEIRSFNDSLQASAPIRYKLEYDTRGDTTYPTMRLTVGTGSNGTGSITGNTISPIILSGTSGSATTSSISLLSGANNRIVCAIFGTGSFLSAGIHFAIERTKDNLGNDTTEGALITGISAGSGIKKVNQFLPFIGGVPPVDVLGTIGAINGNGTDGADVITCPNFPFRGSGLMNPGLNVEFYMNAAVNAGTVAPIERYGISRNYYFIGNNTAFTGLLRGNAAWITNSTLAIRWE